MHSGQHCVLVSTAMQFDRPCQLKCMFVFVWERVSNRLSRARTELLLWDQAVRAVLCSSP